MTLRRAMSKYFNYDPTSLRISTNLLKVTARFDFKAYFRRKCLQMFGWTDWKLETTDDLKGNKWVTVSPKSSDGYSVSTLNGLF